MGLQLGQREAEDVPADLGRHVSNDTIAAYKYRKPLIKGRCGKCQFFEICNGNFRARAKYATGDNWESDPACYLTDEEIGAYKGADGRYHSHDPKIESETEELKQKADHYRSLGMNVPLALAAEAVKGLGAIPRHIGEMYVEQAKTLGPGAAALAAEAEFTKPDTKKLQELETLKAEAQAAAAAVADTNPTTEQLTEAGAGARAKKKRCTADELSDENEGRWSASGGPLFIRGQEY